MQLQMFRSGSSGNCSLLTVGATRLLIDAGVGPRVLAKELAVHGLAVKDLTGVIYTHCHSDHLKGNTLSLFAREGVPVYLNEGTWRMARRREASGELGRMPVDGLHLFDNDRPFAIDGLEIEAFSISHGQPGPENHAGDPVGFVMRDGRETFGYCTDIGHVTPEIVARLKPADLLVLECNHDIEMVRLSARPWPVKQWILSDSGHLNNAQTATALAELFSGREGAGVVLAHLSEMCNTIGMARETAKESLLDRCEVAVGVANRHHATLPWVLEGGRARPIQEHTPAYFQPTLF